MMTLKKEKSKKVVWYRRRGMKRIIPGAILVGIILMLTLLSLVWTPYDPNATNLYAIGLAPFARDANGGFHLLGTDQLGRDMLSRTMVGGQMSLLIAVLVVLCSAVIGTILGVISGFFEGWFDHFMGMVVEIQHSIPMVVIIIFIISLFGSSIWVLAGGLAVSEWFSIFRQTRAKTFVEKNKDYVLATRVLGAKKRRLVFNHLLPNVIPTTIVFATMLIATVILAEAGLSFLGLGVSRPHATWGRMVSDGQTLMASAWWISTVPAMFIATFVIGINMLGDGIRQVFRME